MSFMLQRNELIELAKKWDVNLLEGRAENKPSITLYANKEEDLTSFLELIKEKGNGVVYFREYTYLKEYYEIPISWADEQKYGKFTKRIEKEIIKYNTKILPQIEEDTYGFQVFGYVNPFSLHQITLVDDRYDDLEDPEEAFNSILNGEDFWDLTFYLEENVQNLRLEEQTKLEKEKKEKRKPLEKTLKKDEVFLACTTKGARMLRIKEVALELGIVELTTMSKVDLESYVDLLQIKFKLNQE